MSRWHRENPEHYELYGEPDWLGNADLIRKQQKEEGNGFYSVPRKCSRCEFETLNRDEFWQHVGDHGEFA